MDTPLASGLLAAQQGQIDQGIEGVVDGSSDPQALAASLTQIF